MSLSTTQRAAMETALHELTTLDGLLVADGAAPGEMWSIDTSEAVCAIKTALKEDDPGK